MTLCLNDWGLKISHNRDMSNNEIKLSAHEVSIGMYVTKLDRPWLDTPFMLQGFMINDEQDLITLREHCEHCYVDRVRSKNFDPSQIDKFLRTGTNALTRRPLHYKKRDNTKIEPVEQKKLKKKRIYSDLTEMQDELADVREHHKTMTDVFKDMMNGFKLNRKLDIAELKSALSPMVDSIIRNPDALLWLNRLRVLDDYHYSHAIGCSIWAMSLGRQLGMTRIDIESLGLGGLLLDVGKTKLPKKLLSKKEALTKDEVKALKGHVKLSMEVVDNDKSVNIKVKNMIESHHERVDGTGYPLGLKGDMIPLFGRIAAVVDCYDAITSERVYADPLSSQEAVKRIYEWRGREFQAELVEEFIQAIGMFPAGTMVELTNGEVGVVTAESRTRRLRPKVMLLLNADKSPRDEYVICNLMQRDTDDQGNPLGIKHALPSGAYNLKADEFFL